LFLGAGHKYSYLLTYLLTQKLHQYPYRAAHNVLPDASLFTKSLFTKYGRQFNRKKKQKKYNNEEEAHTYPTQRGDKQS